MFAIHVKPGLVSFSARLQTTFALLMPRLWWSAPPDRLLSLPLRVIMIRVPLRCHSSSPPHSFQSGFGVSFALNSALWLNTVSVEHSLQLWCASAVSTLRFADSDVTPRCCFFSCNDKAVWLQRDAPERYDRVKIWYPSVGLRCFSSEHMWDAYKKAGCHPWFLSGMFTRWDWRSHSQVGREFQTRLSVCAASLWKQIKIILTSAVRNVLNLEPRRGETQRLIAPN